MLWSPNEVIAYLKEDLGVSTLDAENKQLAKATPTKPFGGFELWPSTKEDFILIAENSEIHGPNPLFTIPDLNSSIDLNALSTQILSADYQGLSNNKILPGSNAQLLMPDLAVDVHAAINYFFLFDSEARGYVRPTCLAYFTSDKHKLIKLAKPIFTALSEVAAIFQHSNILHHTSELRSLRDCIHSSTLDIKNSVSKGIAAETQLKDIQSVLEIAENFKENDLYSKHTSFIMEYLKTNSLSERILNMDTLFPTSTKASSGNNLYFRPNIKKSLKNLYLICKDGLVLGLYHLFLVHKYFKRKYENIAVSERFNKCEGDKLYLGACVKTTIRKSTNDHFQLSECYLQSCRVPSSTSLQSDSYFECLDNNFENILLNFINWGKDSHKTFDQSSSSKSLFCDSSDSCEFQRSSSFSSGYNSAENNYKLETCRHIVPLNKIWDTLDYITMDSLDIEASFLRVLQLFGDSQRLLFSMFTRVPIAVISTPQELQTAQGFIKALSVFIPRRKNEILFVDFNRQLPLKREDLSELVAVNMCIDNQVIEDLIPLQLLSSLCILNLKDCSLTSPRYFGRLLANVDQQIRALPPNGPVFPVLVSTLLEIEETVKWWHMLLSSSADTTTAAKHVLSKGYNRLDMQIIEKLSRLCKD
ncbi:hypothetical protein JTE90_022828 [Oedothorax gibbosus]|uniref:UDENN FLCN/SMCR8-type domain-containing protein n=1 Tax=Oedothorax gibbosus TaxID=931172 RepID=A0AAV6V5K0_9ARAC|nr:hypothetical protein JTE90_022828 [Oedothorax gibbosus]